jgi:flagellar hook assembly protein FlgD
MSIPRTLALVLSAAALAPAQAGADVRMVTRDVPLGATSGSTRALAARAAPLSFNMVGLHWRGPGTVSFRTESAAGRWSAWQSAVEEEEDAPDRGSSEAAATAGWRLGSPYWTGAAHRIQYRLSGRVTRLRAHFISSDVTAAPSVAEAGVAARPSTPTIIRRRQWGANESIVRGSPSYAPAVRLAIVHHTAGTNSYTAAQAAAIVRGIQRYHVLGNGWDDIGYNFLVSKQGQIFEGRAGGVHRTVIGAHARGFNTGSTGVALLGTYSGVALPSAGRAALNRLLAWRLDVAHVDPRSVVRVESLGNERFPAGRLVRLRAISGHRDTGSTSCPGSTLYGSLGAIARSVSGIGLPKLYSPRVSGRLGGPVSFAGRLSSSRAWTVTVRDSVGAVVARGRGSGTAIAWTWDSSAALIARYRWTIASGSAVRPASGVVPGPPPLATRELRVVPGAITPNGDGNGDRTRISFVLSRRALVRIEVRRSGAPVKTLVDDRELAAGPVTAVWGARSDAGAPVADGRYWVRIFATSGAEQVARSRPVVVDRTLHRVGVHPTLFSPNGDGKRDTVAISYELTKPAAVRLQILRAGRALGTIFSSPAVPAGKHVRVWNGRLRGNRLPDGRYVASVQATTTLGTRTLTRTLRIDTTPPRVRVLSARVRSGVTRVRIALTERADVRIWYGSETWRDGDSLLYSDRPAGEQVIRRRGAFGVVRIVAWDGAENPSRAATARVSR